MKRHSRISIGCAGWNVPRESGVVFPDTGSHLERYAAVFSAVEINSSFYRPHRPQTYRRWAATVPDHFRFSVKVPRVITHEQRLVDATGSLLAFFEQTAELGPQLGCYLIQLPPSLAFRSDIVGEFLEEFRTHSSVPAVCEPRHASWFRPEAFELLENFQVGFVRADPPPVPITTDELPQTGPVYWRLHGSPRIYYSVYSESALETFACQIRDVHRNGADVWCIFDNTALGAAPANAFWLQTALEVNNANFAS